jgi:hypothetical protein
LYNDIVTISFDDNSTTTYAVHHGLICFHSSFFRGALQGGFSESANKEVVLPAEEKEPFRTFLSWIYRMQLHDAGVNFIMTTGTQAIHMIKTYIFADKRGIPGLKNAIIDLLISAQIAERCIPTRTMQKAWEGTSENDGLRKLFVDWHVYCPLVPHFVKVGQPDLYLKEMLLVVLDRVIRRDSRPARRSDAEWKRLKCLYHDHIGAEVGGSQGLNNS